LGDDKKYEVVSGERRLRAAKLVGLKKIPCIIIADHSLAEEIALVENIQRQDLHPIELGDAFLKILNDRKGMSQLELSERLGMSNKVVSEVIQYARLPKEVKDAVISKKIVGRDYLRKLLKSKDPIDLINKVSPVEKTNRSILRIMLNDGEFRVQLGSLDFLSDDQKINLKTMMMDVIKKF
jgi:ParB family chromosome partitioning protein